MSNPHEAATNVARTARQLRELRGWTQQRLSELSGVPRPTIASLESGGANPTLSVLVRISTAFGVGLDELIAPPRATGTLVRAEDLPTKRHGTVTVRALVPDTIPGVVVERMHYPRGATLSGTPHKPGTREYLTCERGRIALTASGTRFELGPGDVVVFRGDQRHGYQNLHDAETICYSVVLPAP